MKTPGTSLLLLLACVLPLHGLEYSNKKLGFKATLPDGLQDLSASVMRRDSLVTIGKLRADKKGTERLITIEDMKGVIGRDEFPKPSDIPNNVRVEKLPWKTFEVLLFVVSEVEAGVPTVTLNAQVPLKPSAVQVTVHGPQRDEAQLRQELKAIVASVEGPSNWLNSEERITRLSHGVGKLCLWGCLGVIAVAGAIKIFFGRKRRRDAVDVADPLPAHARETYGRAEEVTAYGSNTLGRLLVCGLVVYAAMVGLIVYTDNGKTDMAARMGAAMGTLIIPLFITGLWAAKSSKEWGWFRYGFTLVAMLVIVTVIRIAPHLARIQASENRAQPAAAQSQPR